MTTIAYRAGIMAADSAVFRGSTVVDTMQKITRLPNGALLGCSGQRDLRDLADLLSHDEQPTRAKLADLKAEYDALLARPDGRLFTIQTYRKYDAWAGHWAEQVRGFSAIGSGMDVAIGALAVGSSAREAVLAACRHDAWTRPPVTTMRIGRKGSR